MLLEFKVSNYKSIREQIVFSMLAGKDDSHEAELYSLGNYRVLRMASVYGANASGKTTLIDAMGYMAFLVCECTKFQEGDAIPRWPHKLSLSEPSELSVQFEMDGIRYVYGFSVMDHEVQEEYLYHFPAGRPAKVFDRDRGNFSFGAAYKRELTDIIEKSKGNKLFLSTAEAWCRLPQIVQPFRFFKEQVMVHTSEMDNWLPYSTNEIQQNGKAKKMMVEFFRKIGVPIRDILVKTEAKEISLANVPPQVREILRAVPGMAKPNFIEVKFVYDSYVLDLQEESVGTQKLFKMICPLMDVLSKGKILLYDELERSLHPAIVSNLLAVVKKWRGDTQPQLIFTTHDTSLLDLDLFRRDQIWFAERNPETKSSEYYSLVELKNVRKDENIRKGYVMGRYAPIPLKGSSLMEVLDGEHYGA